MTSEVYRRLPGSYRTLLRKWTLWIAADHVLLIQSSHVAEQYKRFYFRDIQAIEIARRDGVSNRPGGRIAVLAILLLLVGLNLVGLSYRSTFGFGFSAVLLAGYVAWWLRRPDCACQIQTATRTEPIPPLCRYSSAMEVVSELRSKIEAAQNVSAAGAESSEQPQPPPLV